MRVIGKSELRIFPLALGGNPFGWTADKATSDEVLDAFVAGGGNFIDTADGYSAWVPGNAGGESETIIGDWMAARKNRDAMIIATKVSSHPQFKGLSARTIAAAADASLARLRTDRLDLYYAHFDDADTPLEETLGAFDALVRSGKVRYVGISNYSPERIEEWLRIARASGFALPVALQPHYNLVVRAHYEKDLAPIAEREQLGVFPWASLASGFLTGKYRSIEDTAAASRQSVTKYVVPAGLAVLEALDEVAAAHGSTPTTVALAWLLTRKTITAPLASVSRSAQLPELLAAPALSLREAEVARLDDASRPFA